MQQIELFEYPFNLNILINLNEKCAFIAKKCRLSEAKSITSKHMNFDVVEILLNTGKKYVIKLGQIKNSSIKLSAPTGALTDLLAVYTSAARSKNNIKINDKVMLEIPDISKCPKIKKDFNEAEQEILAALDVYLQHKHSICFIKHGVLKINKNTKIIFAKLSNDAAVDTHKLKFYINPKQKIIIIHNKTETDNYLLAIYPSNLLINEIVEMMENLENTEFDQPLRVNEAVYLFAKDMTRNLISTADAQMTISPENPISSILNERSKYIEAMIKHPLISLFDKFQSTLGYIFTDNNFGNVPNAINSKISKITSVFKEPTAYLDLRVNGDWIYAEKIDVVHEINASDFVLPFVGLATEMNRIISEN